MKRILVSAFMLALFTAPAFAAKNAETLTISEPVTVASTQLPAAEYKVTWTATGADAQVTIVHGKTTVTVPAKVVEQKNGVNSILTNSKGGSNSLEAINLKNLTLVLANTPAPGQ